MQFNGNRVEEGAKTKMNDWDWLVGGSPYLLDFIIHITFHKLLQPYIV